MVATVSPWEVNATAKNATPTANELIAFANPLPGIILKTAHPTTDHF
jgi:hypothetical protein